VVLVAAQLLHAVTFAAHHAAVDGTGCSAGSAGALQARGQALYISTAYGIGATAGGLFMSLCWDRLGPGAVYACCHFAAAGLAVLLDGGGGRGCSAVLPLAGQELAGLVGRGGHFDLLAPFDRLHHQPAQVVQQPNSVWLSWIDGKVSSQSP
jgi:hypothetical protein